MRRADRKRWAACRTLDDLCQVTAAWLRGEVQQTPSHLGPPSPETLPLLGVLEAANLAGFLTDTSQPGMPMEDGCGQRAAVMGFADDPSLSMLMDGATSAGLTAITHLAAKVRTRYSGQVVVTMDGGRPFTALGAQLSERHLRWAYGSRCHQDAVLAVCNVWQVTLIDLEWGRNDRLWPVLEKFASERKAA